MVMEIDFIGNGVSDISFGRRLFTDRLWPAPQSPPHKEETPRRKPRQHQWNECYLSPTAPLGNGNSPPKVFIAALHTPFRRPSLLDAKLILVPCYTLIVVLLAQMKIARPYDNPNHRCNDAKPLPSDKAHLLLPQLAVAE